MIFDKCGTCIEKFLFAVTFPLFKSCSFFENPCMTDLSTIELFVRLVKLIRKKTVLSEVEQFLIEITDSFCQLSKNH